MNWFLSGLTSVAVIALGLLLILQLPSVDRPVMDQHTEIFQAGFCANARALCTEKDYETVQLPHRLPRKTGQNGQAGTYRIDVASDVFSGALPAIAIPRFSDNILVWINGQAVSPDRRAREPFLHHWNRPLYSSFARTLVEQDISRIEIELYALPSGYIALSTVLLGPSETLEFGAQKIHVRRLGQVRTFTAVAIFSFIPIFGVWLTRRRDKTLGPISAVLFCGIFVGLHLSFPNTTFLTEAWPRIWNAALVGMVFGVYRYVCGWLELERKTIDRVLLAGLCFTLAALVFVPLKHYFYLAMGVQTYSALVGIIAIATLARNLPQRLPGSALHMAGLGLAAAAGCNDYLYYFLDGFAVERPHSGLGLFVIVVGIFTTLFYRLSDTLHGYETITNTMRSTIEARTRELKDSQNQIVAFEKQQAVNAERERIMFDLHDGVGGTVVNLRAYVDLAEVPDPVLQDGLDATIQDMALIFDSLEGIDDAQGLLAQLRDRMDGRANANGFDLQWDLDASTLLVPTGSQTLDLVRLIQEAITNAIRHSGGSIIRVAGLEHSIAISDNGRGLQSQDAVSPKFDTRRLGLRSMENRARQMGASLTVESRPDGTHIKVVWPNAQSHG